MDQWQYTQQQGDSRRYAGGGQSSQPQAQQQRPARYNGAPQLHVPSYQHEQFTTGATDNHLQSVAPSPRLLRDGSGDIAMQDFVARPHHQAQSSVNRLTTQQSGEQSSAAQRYSPMETLSPANQYPASPNTNSNSYSAMRQSPTRANTYSSTNSYYPARAQAQHLPPITPHSSSMNEGYPQSATQQLNAVFGNDPKSPSRARGLTATATLGRGPVPEFRKLRSSSELQPKINAQPAFRRANPEGGFISVCTELLVLEILR